MRKFKVGDRVKIINREAMRTCAQVKIGQTGRVVTAESSWYPDVVIDGDETRWSIPPKGLKLIKPTKED